MDLVPHIVRHVGAGERGEEKAQHIHVTVASQLPGAPTMCAHCGVGAHRRDGRGFEVTPGGGAFDGKEGKCTNTRWHSIVVNVVLVRGPWYNSWRSRARHIGTPFSEPAAI